MNAKTILKSLKRITKEINKIQSAVQPVIKKQTHHIKKPEINLCDDNFWLNKITRNGGL